MFNPENLYPISLIIVLFFTAWGFILSGINALKTNRTVNILTRFSHARKSADNPHEKYEYSGLAALFMGIFFIVLGLTIIFFLIFVLYPLISGQ